MNTPNKPLASIGPSAQLKSKVDDSAADSIEQRAATVLANNYGSAPLTLQQGKGARVITSAGQELLDFGSGISVTSFGHKHPAIRAAIDAQLDQLWHTSNLYYTEPAINLAQALCDHSFAQRVFFANSGAEANEAAIKLVRKAASATRPPEQREILTFNRGFHGRTLATVTATAQPKYHQGFEPLPTGFRYGEFNNVEALAESFDQNVCAVLIEPVQGEGGIHPASDEFMMALRELCNRHNAWLIVDEVQCGMGRTGSLWAYQNLTGIEPDVLTTAKALGGGLPIGALLIGDALKDVLTPGTHGSTFGGNPVCCAAALAALALAQDEQLLSNVRQRSEQLMSMLNDINSRLNVFSEIRGRGLMIGAQLKPSLSDHISEVLSHALAEGLLVLQAAEGTVRLLPPLTLTEQEATQGMDLLERALKRSFQAS